MGIESIENVVREPITVELSEDYNVKWTKEKIQFPDAKYSFELYKGVEDGGSLVFFIKEINILQMSRELLAFNPTLKSQNYITSKYTD